MKLIIKNSVSVLALFSTVAVFAGCGQPTSTSSSVQSSFRQDIKGAPAESLMKAFGQVGVGHTTPSAGEEEYRVTSLRCVTPDGSDMDNMFSSQCDFVDTSRSLTIHLKGTSADTLIAALDHAGIRASIRKGVASYFLNSLDCSQPDGSDMDMMFTAYCMKK